MNMQTEKAFYVEQWQAFIPGVEPTISGWKDFFSDTWQADETKADVSFLPAMQRRRLSSLARAVAKVVHDCSENEELAMVFCTRYAEIHFVDAILRDIAAGQEVSPTAFGLSVYNAIAGQISIMQNNKQAMTTVVPEKDDYLTAFVDALGLLGEEHKNVVLVFYDEPVMDLLKPDHEFVFSDVAALAVKISVENPNESAKKMHFSFIGEHIAAEPAGYGLLALIRFFALEEAHLQLGRWQLRVENGK